jgi:2,4-dienoyl-CoA reductase (NADPH2)
MAMTPPDAASPGTHQPFRFRTADALLRVAETLGVRVPFSERIDVLLEPVVIASRVLPNRIAVQPMEGCDADPNGGPGELTRRRYRRYAEGGSGLIWFEATSVVPEGRANPRQLLLSRATLPSFAALVDATRRAATARFGLRHQPFLVLQITHSGRFSNPRGPAAPGRRRIACANPHLDIPGEAAEVWRDEELDALVDVFVEAIALATDAGFDAVDVKACHGYLLHELLGAHTRTDSRYGGAFENRARFLTEVVARTPRHTPGAAIAVRLNATDGIPHPFGFGMAPDGSHEMDLAEPLALARRLAGAGCRLLNVTAGIPAQLPHLGRPFDRTAGGGPAPPEHPLVGVARLLRLAAALQQEVPEVPMVGTGYSWLRQFWPHVAAAVLEERMAGLVGLGRGAFAYPDAPLDLMERGVLDPRKCCVACSYCTELMRRQEATGCIVRDHVVYRTKRRRRQD